MILGLFAGIKCQYSILEWIVPSTHLLFIFQSSAPLRLPDHHAYRVSERKENLTYLHCQPGMIEGHQSSVSGRIISVILRESS